MSTQNHTSVEAALKLDRRESLVLGAAAEISDLSRAARGLIDMPDGAMQVAAKALLVRIEKLTDAVFYCLDPASGQKIEDAESIVGALDAGVRHA